VGTWQGARPAAVVALVVLLVGAALAGVASAAQVQPAPHGPRTPPPGSVMVVAVEPSGETATLTYFNRPIVILRAKILGRRPAERVKLATMALDDLVAEGRTGPVEARAVDGGVLIGVGSKVIVGLTPTDIDELAGETLDGVTHETVKHLEQALDEAAEAYRPVAWLRGGALALAALGAGLLLFWVSGRTRRFASNKMSALTAKAIARSGLGDQHAARVSQLLEFFQRRFVTVVVVGLRLAVTYIVVTFILRQFPYTRPWGESLRGFLIAGVRDVVLAIVGAMPNLFTIFIIILITRAAIKLLEPWFEAVERGGITVPWMHPETAVTTRRLVTVILWLFAAAIAYPYVPGSNTDAFKGLSVVLALMVTLGSTGFVNQVMSGFMVTYSRALRLGDFVKVGDVEGTIIHLGVLSTKLRTLRHEEVTIPNAVLVAQMTTDYSRFAESVLTTTCVTIGYDAPWRQVHAMLLLAAERTPGIRRDPKPRVLQTALEDAAVKYTLSFSLERQQSKFATLSVLHAHIQDLFNEYGVQIMTPRYEADPEKPKLVPKQEWFAAPAQPDRRPEARESKSEAPRRTA
jgi:small-conductance mechanosensitive channel